MLKRFLTIFVVFIVIIFSFVICAKKEAGKLDILITQGKIVDGMGNPWFYGDLGIRGDTIVEIGDLSGKEATKTIDAKGMVVSPGFIDMHTHCDRGLGLPETNANLNYITQGVTTVVTGNCGGSVSLKVAETKAKWEEQGIGTNAVFLVGHGTIRRAVMGIEPRESTPEEIEKMKEILRQSMREGAWGMSTGLEYSPGIYSNTEEVIDLAKVVSEFDGVYITHKRSEREYVREAVEETIRIGEEGDLRADISHLKLCGKNYWGLMEDVVKMVNDARTRGIYVTADMYPYNTASSGPISSYIDFPEDMEPLTELREKMRDRNLSKEERGKFKDQYMEELEKALSDPSKRAQIKEATSFGLPLGLHNRQSAFARWGWDSFPVVVTKKNTHLLGKVISELAEEQNRDPFDIVEELFLEERDEIHLATGAMSEDDMKLAMKEDWLMFSSDGSALKYDPENPAHPRNYGSFPRVFRKYVREEGVLSMEDAVRRMTTLPASLLQMKDRGMLARGYKADIVIFDPDTIRDNATHADSHQYSTGIEYSIINGKIGIENGEYNGSLNGKLLLLTENK